MQKKPSQKNGAKCENPIKKGTFEDVSLTQKLNELILHIPNENFAINMCKYFF